MAFHLKGAKPLCKTSVIRWQLNNKNMLQLNLNQNMNIFLQEIELEYAIGNK